MNKVQKVVVNRKFQNFPYLSGELNYHSVLEPPYRKFILVIILPTVENKTHPCTFQSVQSLPKGRPCLPRFPLNTINDDNDDSYNNNL